ncbi:PilW family protein [uncultured Porticoccus sp.]|uniref:PilW family protein n=1 Tax=uncultured Porticoccus sp. TaxID=1256050 RepID=UPI0026351C1D|nr:PilW family protein [uncultured Porticoccus sp.]
MSADRTRQYGLSMVELLVAMALGLLLTVGALQMMLASQQLYDTTDSQSRVQENGRFALDFLSREISKAYYQTNDVEVVENRTFLTQDCAGNNACTENATVLAGDQIAAVYNPENDRDCADNTVGPDDIIANVFYLNTVDGVSALNCRGFNLESNSWIGVGQPLVDGVESLHILYRVELAGGGSFSYVSADDVDDWAAVSAVRVAVLVNNGQEIGSGNLETRTFTLLDAGPFALTDKHERQVYSTTITLNNVIYNNAEK